MNARMIRIAASLALSLTTQLRAAEKRLAEIEARTARP